jgi:hypothetical protein
MTSKLPKPIDNILALWLPPDLAEKEENTLGYLLRQPELTWEALVVRLTHTQS